MNSKDVNKVTIAVTGLAWMGHGIGSIYTTIEELLINACDEVQIAAYGITAGAKEFIELIAGCLSRGLIVTVIVNKFGNQPKEIQMTISKLAQRYPHFTLLEFKPMRKNEDLHAKLIVVDRSRALIGSPNLTWKGLVSNHELAVLVEGPAAGAVANLLDVLAKDSRTRPVLISKNIKNFHM
jgi:phosphatidylserine/phosphatidylglycerophosphate/cardiolipin synthase-like enzyme